MSATAVGGAPRAPSVTDLIALVAEVTGVRLGPDVNFFAGGLTSVLLVGVHRALVDRHQVELVITDLFRFPTLRALTDRLAGDGAQARPIGSQGVGPAPRPPRLSPAPPTASTAAARRALRGQIREMSR